jgi:type II secretory ATPase GspE/PulE/Tfp pilus assembly ATPase PilB-like protein
MSMRQEFFRIVACPVGKTPAGAIVVWVSKDTPEKREEVLAVIRQSAEKVTFVEKTSAQVNEKINEKYPPDKTEGESGPEATLRQIIETANALGVSDILIEPEPYANSPKSATKFAGKVRFDIEGVLDRPWYIPLGKKTREERMFFTSYETYMRTMRLLRSRASVSPDDEGVPGDGRLSWGEGESAVEYRVSIIPTSLGPKAVLRQVASQAKVIPVDQLSFPEAFTPALNALRRKGAFVLIVGVPRAGKTTTAYALITALQLDELNVYTIENPVEALLPGMSQINIPVEAVRSSDSQMTMDKAMKALVRQRPDLALVGEIRDKETVDNALNIGSAGIGVMATLHAPRAASAFDRLVALGANEGMMRRTVSAVIAQELLRRLCTNCKEIDTESGGFKANPNGCVACNHRGYSGMIAVMEMMERETAADGSPIWKMTLQMEDMALHAIREGVTDPAEVDRVFGEVPTEMKLHPQHRRRSTDRVERDGRRTERAA